MLPTNPRCHFRAMLPFRLERIPSCIICRCPLLRIFLKTKSVFSEEDDAKRGSEAPESADVSIKIFVSSVSERRIKNNHLGNVRSPNNIKN